MCEDFYRCHLQIAVTPHEASAIADAVQVSNQLTAAEPGDNILVPDIHSPFRADYPGTAGDPLADFYGLFSDREWPIFGASVTAQPAVAEGIIDLSIDGDDIEIDSFAQLLFHSARSALPIELRYDVFAHANDSQAYRCGFVLITEVGIIFGSGVDSTVALTGSGYVIAADTDDQGEPLLFWNSDDGFGDAASATVFAAEEVQLHCLPLGSTKWMCLPSNIAVPASPETELMTCDH